MSRKALSWGLAGVLGLGSLGCTDSQREGMQRYGARQAVRGLINNNADQFFGGAAFGLFGLALQAEAEQKEANRAAWERYEQEVAEWREGYNTAYAEWVDENGNGNREINEMKGKTDYWNLSQLRKITFSAWVEKDCPEGLTFEFCAYDGRGWKPVFSNKIDIPIEKGLCARFDLPAEIVERQGVSGRCLARFKSGQKDLLSYGITVSQGSEPRKDVVKQREDYFVCERWNDKNGNGLISEDELEGRGGPFKKDEHYLIVSRVFEDKSKEAEIIIKAPGKSDYVLYEDWKQVQGYNYLECIARMPGEMQVVWEFEDGTRFESEPFYVRE